MRTLYGHMTRFAGTRVAAVGMISLALVAIGCGRQSGSLTGPSAIVPSTAVKPADVDGSGTTTVSFADFNQSALTVTVNTLTASAVGQPYIDDGKIHLEILVDGTGHPVPCGTVGGVWVRIDGANGGLDVSGATTSHSLDLDNLSAVDPAVQNAECGDSICIRALYITGGGNPKVDTHFSDPTPFDIECSGCTLTQGFWKTHYPDDWPAAVLAGGLTLGTVVYTAAQLEDIFNTPVGGNGLISLAHQLIAAKLNIANGADGTAVAGAIAAADALIGSLVIPPVGSGSLAPSVTGALTSTLDDYNRGVIGPGHCEDGD